MALLRDSIVQGSLRVTDTIFTNDLNLASATASKIVKTDENKNLIAEALEAAEIPDLAASKITSGTLSTARGGTGNTTGTATYATTDAETSAALYIVGVKSDATSDLKRNTLATLTGAVLTLGNASTAGKVSLYDASSNTGTLVSAALGANRTWTFPNATGTVALTSSNITGTAANVTGTVAIDHGGTNATTAVDARTNLGLGSIATYNAAPAGTKDTWGLVPVIGADGVIEIGKYIDFHTTDGNTKDYDVRITAATTGLTISGTTTGTFSGNLTGDVTGDVSGSSGSCTGNAATATKWAAAQTVYVALGTASKTKTILGDSSSAVALGIDGTLAIGHGGTGLTASPSMLTNLGSTTAADILAASPRPGITGTLGVGHGGTGVTTTEKIFATYGVEYIVGTLTAATGAWTGVTKSSALYIGKTIAYKLPYAGSGNATLELTLTAADGTTNTTTGAKAVYAGNTRLTTHYPANTIMVMVWNGTDWRTNAYYNTNDDYRCRLKVITDDKERSLLLADPVVGTADNNTLYVTRRNDSIYAVASTGTIHATAFNGSTAAFSGTTASTSTSTGAVTVSGGLGVAGLVTAARVGAGGSNTSYALYVSGNSFHNGIAYFGNGTTYYVNKSGNAKFNTLTAASTLSVTGATTLSGALTVAGATTLNGKLVGSSNNYGATLPSSGQTTGQIFFQTSNPIYELPTGGTTGLALVKASNTNRDVQWGGPYLPLTGGTVSGLITMSKASGESWYIAERTGGNRTAFGIGYGGVNRGVYDLTLDKWIIYCDGTNASSQLKLYGAVWNDYAEFRKDNPNENLEAGRCVSEIGDGSLRLTLNRLELGCEIVSDTFGFAIGQDKENGYNTPIASSGRVLAYPFEEIEDFRSHIGWPVCSGPNGTVSIMTKEEEREYPSRIIGTISEIPSYNEWGTDKVKVNGRVWIRIR